MTYASASTLRRTALLCLAGATLPAAAQFASPVRNVENPDRTPYAQYATAAIPTGYANTILVFPKPAGKTVIVEQISVQCSSTSAIDRFPLAYAAGWTSTTGGSTSFPQAILSLTYRGASVGGGFVSTASGPVSLVSNVAGTDSLTLNVFHTDYPTSATCSGSMIGHTFTP